MTQYCRPAVRFRALVTYIFLLLSTHVFGVGWTPTDAGFVMGLEPGDQFLLSVWVDLNGNNEEDAGEEFFVCDYPSYHTETGRFRYEAKDNLKLVPQAAGATTPSPASIWTVGAPLNRVVNKVDYSLGGISYTMWGNSGKTLITYTKTKFKFLGDLAEAETKGNDACLCDVVFVVPSNNTSTKSMDPNKTLSTTNSANKRTDQDATGKFNAKTGIGFADMVYREVYWFDIPRTNTPNAYTNASLVTFNTTSSNKTWANGDINCKPGMAAYAFADDKHKPTVRTVFRLYMLNDKEFASCDGYYFGWNIQEYKKYRQSNTLTDSTSSRKIYRFDHFECMEYEEHPDSSFYKTRVMKMLDNDSTYYYVGYNNTYLTDATYAGSGSPTNFRSQFQRLSELRIRPLKDAPTAYFPPKSAYGSFVIDTLRTSETNLGLAFEPAGYFLKVPERDFNVQMHQVDDTTWISEEMWTISAEWAALTIKATLFTGSEYSPTDLGADIPGWSIPITGNTVPLANGGGTVGDGTTGWVRIHTNRNTPNGGMDFVLANADRHIDYDNNYLVGIEVPDQYPTAIQEAVDGKIALVVQDARLKDGFTFRGWTRTVDSIGVKFYHAGDTIQLTAGTTKLYAQGWYNDTYRVAFSFIHPTNGKRYFLTHPGVAPRFARARTFTDWTDVYQGMENEKNLAPNYLTTYKMIVKPTCELCEDAEVVLDPRHETVRGAVDSLTFYENWAPEDDEFIGLYFDKDPGTGEYINTILANNTWAGIFKSTEGWPSYRHTKVDNTKLYSTHYFSDMDSREGIQKTWRGRPVDPEDPSGDSVALAPYVKYNPTYNQFDGDTEANATSFQITGVAVADEHYVILPDTTEDDSQAWRDEIFFGYHQDEQQQEQVWSKLIGKQLMAVIRVGEDTVYFHPNRSKIITTASALRLSLDFRLTHDFEFIHDARPDAALAVGDSVMMEETSDAFSCNLTSGTNSPMDVMDGANYIDVIDTLRVWLRPGGNSKIKSYYGRWRTGATGVHVRPDGARYRDILIKTKTYHYGANDLQMEILPTQENYNFSALKDQRQTLDFILRKVTYRPLLDAEGNEVSREIIQIDTIADVLNLTTGTTMRLTVDTIFQIGTKAATSISLTTKKDNSAGMRVDTLTVTVASITVGGETYTDVTAKVPLAQSSMQGDELVWSVVHNGTRYFIMAGKTGEGTGTGHFVFRRFSLRDNTLYKFNTATPLKKGAATPANTDDQYITPWMFALNPSDRNQSSLKTADGVNKFLGISGDDANLQDAGTYFTYRLISTNANANANYEEEVRIKYGAGEKQWLTFDGTKLTLQADSASASLFYWGYLQKEFNLLNNGTYPSADELVFVHDNGSAKSVQTRYQGYSEYSMLLDNTLTYLCREEEDDIADLAGGEWQISRTIERIADARSFDGGAKSSDLGISTNATTLVTTVTPGSATSPTNVSIGGKYVNIVDTLKVTLTSPRTDYRFKGDWSGFKSLSDAGLKIPLIRKTYHSVPYDSIMCEVDGEEYNFAFRSSLRAGQRSDSLHTFTLRTIRYQGTNIIDADGNKVTYTPSGTTDLTSNMNLSSPAMAEIRFVDDYGKKPDWCEIAAIGTNTITIRCKSNGIRTPRSANLYFAYVVTVGGAYQYVNYMLTVSQASLFQYANNQTLIHTPGASGDPLMADGRQQVHENKRILYYYNPGNYGRDNQEVELPIRERGFYGWWRWYREGNDEYGNNVSDMDAPDSLWITPPRNVYKNFKFPFRTIGDSVMLKKKDGTDSVKVLVTMGRYTVFHYPAYDYQDGSKKDPPSKSPRVVPPIDKKQLTYVVDLSAYYDNLPLSMAQVNQIDTAVLDTMQRILEPTLSLREVFELHPWTEMAAIMEGYKSANGLTYELSDEKYMEDHVVMAPTGSRLLLKTEQRYRYDNLLNTKHSESLLGYYMRDDNWSSMSDEPDEDGVTRQDTMIWCGGYDADCQWYTYNPSSKTYTECNYNVTVDDDFLNVPAKGSISGTAADTVYYCLRSRSKATTRSGTPEKDVTVAGAYWFNICRYMVVYHDPRQYGPLLESGKGKAAKAIKNNDEIEQNYEVLERLNFDYVKPGKDYHVYPHPLPWADGSYGYSYPVRPDIPDNRHHNNFAPNFPGIGEYSLINRIVKTGTGGWYQRLIEQHGGAENGYMIFCDGMNSAGQVAALSLETKLCEGQKMYFTGYLGNSANHNPNDTVKARPNFTFTVQGSEDGREWEDITNFMTGDVQPNDKWYQILFPINYEQANKAYTHFRVRIYNMASNFDGNDFILDDMCVFATKPPLIAYQADTKCVEEGKNDSITQVVLRIDYQGFVDESYNDTAVYYTVERLDKDSVRSFVPMEDGYINPELMPGADESKPDTLYGHIRMPKHTYEPLDKDSIFINLQQLIDTFNHSSQVFRQGYLYESLDGVSRPVMYVVHEAKMAADNEYNVRMSLAAGDLLDSKCAMTSRLNVTNRMMLELNGEEQDNEPTDMCANTTYDLSVRVKKSKYLPGTAPVDVNGSCVNDWLLYGDTADATSILRYGFKYSDIKAVIKDILRHVPATGTNSNQHVRSLNEINLNDLIKYSEGVSLTEGVVPYNLLDSLVSKGFLTLYERKITATVTKNDSIQYVVFPIAGTGSEAMTSEGMEVCTAPMFIKLKPTKGGDVPMMIGGIRRDTTQTNLPVVVLVNAKEANEQFALHIDSLMPSAAIHSIYLMSTDDPDCYEGVHLLTLEPDRIFNFGGDNTGYYRKNDDILLSPSTSNNYNMRAGYNYTFGIELQTLSGSLTLSGENEGCPVGTIPFTVSVVPNYVRWAPKSKDNNKWNDPENWIGLDENYKPIHDNAHFVPLSSTDVIIPKMTDGLPYPELPNPSRIASTDSVRKVGFTYNSCDDIRFMAGAAISQQQRLSCDVVVADMSTPNKTWALRATPFTGMISGDIFMANTDISGETKPWSVGNFDASGRSYKTGNASFWLSLYNTATEQVIHNGADENITAAAEWSKVTNAMKQSLPAAAGFAVYGRTASGKDADIRLPKNDDTYYYYGTYGERLDETYESDLRAQRNAYAGVGGAGKLAYQPGVDADHQDYTLTNGVESTSFVFGNPTMGYIDIWGFIADNDLEEEFGYLNQSGTYTTVTKSTGTNKAAGSKDTISNQWRYLPPMHAIMIKAKASGTSLDVTLKTKRIVTAPNQVETPFAAPRRQASNAPSKGIMTVTAINPVSNRCVSRLLIGQGYDDAIRSGEDAVLTTLNINNFNLTSTPTTPFNIYAVEGAYGLSIDLRSELMNVPLSFCMSDLTYEPVTQLWFTGVNSIDGELVLYDALTDTERTIVDGICLEIETPEISHEKRYYIRRRGFNPNAGNDPIVATDAQTVTETASDEVQKILRHGQVFIMRNGHVYSIFGQKIR